MIPRIMLAKTVTYYSQKYAGTLGPGLVVKLFLRGGIFACTIYKQRLLLLWLSVE